MNAFISLALMLVFVFCPIAFLLFAARFVASFFSKKVSEQIEKNPVTHVVWGCFAFIGLLVVSGVLSPAMWPPRFLERQQQENKVLERVQKAGGWDAVQAGCEALVSNYPNGLEWFPPRSNAWVYPNYLTHPNRYYVTNLDYGPIPPALATLQAMEIHYHPPESLRKDEPQVPVVRIKIFGRYSTGGHSIPYCGLEVVCTTNAGSYRPPPSRGGAFGNHYNSYKQVTDRIFEVY